MYHYVGLLWDPKNHVAADAAARLGSQLSHASNGWLPRLSAPGIDIFDCAETDAPFQAYLLSRAQGVIFGRLFPSDLERWTPTWMPQIDEHFTTNCVESQGQYLVDNFWGGYVAFLADPRDGSHHVLRDCSGQIPCYRVCKDGVHILFADVADIAHLNVQFGDVNWQYLAAFIFSVEFQARESGFRDVYEVLAGERFARLPNRLEQTTVWDPRNIVRRKSFDKSLDEVSVAASRLRFVTQHCIDAWASVHSNIILSLSGGFDSAVVLGCLCRAPQPPRITCLNRYLNVPAADERQFARLAAARGQVALLEEAIDAGRDQLDDTLLNIPKLLKPVAHHMFVALDADFRNAIIRRVGASAVLTGQGGDHLFFHTHTALGSADFVTQRGIRRGLPSAIDDSARISGDSYWHVARAALKLGRSREPWEPLEYKNLQPHFLASDAVPDLSKYVRPTWAEGICDLPKGKQLQLRLMSEVLHRHKPFPGLEAVHEYHPLMSQPIIETCLAIPSFTLLTGGRDRALARQAFLDYLPREIAVRKGKSECTAYNIGVVRRSAPFVRDLLFGGLLAREGVLNLKTLEPYLLHNQPVRTEQLFPLFSSIAAELWARAWSKDAMQATA
jgi:asparagine synthase (glutamine-hydrolysing)